MALAAIAETDAGDKRPGALRTITEVSNALDVLPHVLRFWETRFPQIRPMTRAGGRRYYRPGEVDLIAGIRHLLHVQRYTIEGAQRVLKENGVRFVQAVGRGEAVAAAPPMPDGADVAGPPSDLDRTMLAEALRELHACRVALAALRAPPDV